ncbi:MAG: hypothetical protein NTX84_02780 [Nitrospirae bacterium]|nr:hypothetical protein [Nitrospirota bacterium]
MPNVTLAVFTVLAIFGMTTFPSPAAGAPKERIALMLTGSTCREIQQTIETVLRHTEGVFAVDGASVSGHLLIDVEEGTISAQGLLTITQAAMATDLSCRVEVMRSCITAPGHNRADLPAK